MGKQPNKWGLHREMCLRSSLIDIGFKKDLGF